MRCFTRDAGISQENSDGPTAKCCPRMTSGLPTIWEYREAGQITAREESMSII
jgi:hypothetical protein